MPLEYSNKYTFLENSLRREEKLHVSGENGNFNKVGLVTHRAFSVRVVVRDVKTELEHSTLVHSHSDEEHPIPHCKQHTCTSSEHTSSEHTSSEHTSSEHTSSEHTSSEHTSSEHTSSEHTSSEHTSSEHTSSEHTSSEHTSSEHVGSKLIC